VAKKQDRRFVRLEMTDSDIEANFLAKIVSLSTIF